MQTRPLPKKEIAALEEKVETIENEVQNATAVKNATELAVSEAEEEKAQAEKELEAAEEATSVLSSVMSLLISLMAESGRKVRSVDISKPTTCVELVAMVEKMNEAFLLGTTEGLALGISYARAIVQDPKPSCSASDRESIAAVKETTNNTAKSVDIIVETKRENVKTAETKLLHAEEAYNNATTELNKKEEELKETKEQLEKIESRTTTGTTTGAAFTTGTTTLTHMFCCKDNETSISGEQVLRNE